MYYAEINRYGIGVSTTIRRKGKELVVSAGNLHRFTTKAQRNAWVADGDKREVLSAREARKYHATGPLAKAVWYRDRDDEAEHFVDRKY
jgi:hypothetical protein